MVNGNPSLCLPETGPGNWFLLCRVGTAQLLPFLGPVIPEGSTGNVSKSEKIEGKVVLSAAVIPSLIQPLQSTLHTAAQETIFLKCQLKTPYLFIYSPDTCLLSISPMC